MSQRRPARRSYTLFQSNWAQQGSGYFSIIGIRNLAHLPSTGDLWCFLCRCVTCPLEVWCVRRRNFLREFIIEYVELHCGLLWRHLWWSMMMRWKCCAGWKGWNSQSRSIPSFIITQKKQPIHIFRTIWKFKKKNKCRWAINANVRYRYTTCPCLGESFFELVLMQKKQLEIQQMLQMLIFLKWMFVNMRQQKQKQSVIHNDSSSWQSHSVSTMWRTRPPILLWPHR